MFERTISMNDAEKGQATVTMTMNDGREVTGNLAIPKALKLAELLNRPEQFLEFQTFEGDTSFYNKNEVSGVAPIHAPQANQLSRPVRDHSAFDPYAILGIERGASQDAIRIAYIGLARLYHPDRFAAIDLPKEIKAYIDAMAKRVNLAYHQLTGTTAAANQA